MAHPAPYVPRYLAPEEAGALYTDALKQAEAAEANAYINYVRAVRAREALEDDIRRLSPPQLMEEPAGRQPGPTENGSLREATLRDR
jgi:hypothetical protein